MSAQTTTWILDLVDHLSSPMKNVVNNSNEAAKGVEKVEKEVNSLHTTMSGVGNILGAFGIGFGLYQVFDYLKKSTEEAGNLRIASAEVKAGLESTQHVAGVTFDAIEKISNGLFHTSKFSEAQLMDMQSILLTFPGVTQKTFGASSQAITDMAAKLHKDLESTAIQVGKALQDPVLGLTALRREGVMLSASETAHVKQLVAEGKKLEAQQLLMKELNTEFAGSAKAAYDATPLIGFKKNMEETSKTIGNLVLDIGQSLSPTLDSLGKVFKSTADWLLKNKSLLYDIGNAALFVGGAFAVYKTITLGLIAVGKIMAFWNAVQLVSINVLGDAFLTASVFQKIFAAGQWAINAAMDANPIGLIIAGIALLVGGFMLAWNKLGWFRGGLMATWETIKIFGGIIKDYVIDRIHSIISGLGGLAKAIGQIFSGHFKEAWETAKKAGADLIGIDAGGKAIEHAKNAGKKIGAAYNKGVAEVAAKDKERSDSNKETKKKDTDLSKNGFSPIIQPTGLGSGSGSGKGGLSGSGGGVGGVKTINQKIEIKNYFTVSGGGDVEGIAEKVVRAINDRLRDATVVLE